MIYHSLEVSISDGNDTVSVFIKLNCYPACINGISKCSKEFLYTFYSFEQRILSAEKYNESIFVIQLQFFKDLQTKGIIFWPHLIG